MKALRMAALVAATSLAIGITGCSKQKAQTPSYKEAVEQSLKNAGFNNVTVDEDRDKGTITLNGSVQSPDEKATAEQDAKAAAPGMVVADQISIEPAGVESGAKKIESNVDSGIDHDFKAALIGNRLEDQHINYSVKNGVITLTGSVATPQMRKQAEQIAASTPNVEQVVNELKIKK